MLAKSLLIAREPWPPGGAHPSCLRCGFVGQRTRHLFCSFLSFRSPFFFFFFSGHTLYTTIECWNLDGLQLKFIRGLPWNISHFLTLDIHSFPVRFLGVFVLILVMGLRESDLFQSVPAEEWSWDKDGGVQLLLQALVHSLQWGNWDSRMGKDLPRGTSAGQL